jgi:hypothetical protein
MKINEGNHLIAEFMKSDALFYESSWDNIMPVIRKINNLDKATQFAIFKTYASCTVEKGGKFYKDFSFSHAEYITPEQTDIEACWKLVVKFISWYNENIMKKDLVGTN